MSEFLIDGLPATEADLHYLAMVNYGAYTSFRVEDGGVRGLDLHLARLDAHAVELFGQAVGQARLRDLLRIALSDRRNAWVRASLFSPDIWSRTPSANVRPKLMTVVSPPPPPLATQMRVRIQTYVREEAHIKHTATLGLIRARRLAHREGFDDALFADTEALISEGPSWNIGFMIDDYIVWPRAPMLAGVTQALIARGLGKVGLTQSVEPVYVSDLTRFDGVFICNSATPACPVTAVGEWTFAADAARIDRIAEAWRLQAFDPI